MVKIKICGIRSLDDISHVNEAGPDYIGFVFAESLRRVDYDTARILKDKLDGSIKAVGVFVNPSADLILKLCAEGIIDMIQLHGNESEDFIGYLKKTVNQPIIKAVRLREGVAERYGNADYVLYDTYADGIYGGTGTCFDWNLIKDRDRPFFLAGGLNCVNVADAIISIRPYCVDISGGVEIDGRKNREKVIEIVNLIRGVE